MPVMIGGDKAWKMRITGDIASSYQWVNGEPAMILFPAMPGLGSGAFVICLSTAWRYANSETGGPSAYLLHQSLLAAQVMGMYPDKFTLNRIVDVILDGLPDLVEMPPEPVGMTAKQAEAVGELSIKVDGQTVREVEVTAPDEVMA